MKRMRMMFVMVCLAACGKSDGGQSLAEGMKVLCATDEEAGVENVAPAERQAQKSKWIDARLKNAEVRKVFEQVGDLPPAERARVVVDLVAKSGIGSCPGLAPSGSGPLVSSPVPELSAGARGAVAIDDTAPMITVIANSDTLVVEGQAVVPLENRKVPVHELEGGAAGRMIPRLRELTKAHVAASPPGNPPLAGARVLLHPEAPYELLMQLLYSMQAAGLKRFDIVARQDGKAVAVPLELPDVKQAHPGLGMVVAVTRTNLVIFSTSGTEGTIQSPKLTTSAVSSAEIARVQATLAEIHARHTDERRIVVMADASVAMQPVTELLAAVRATPDGGKLFTDVLLSSGFE